MFAGISLSAGCSVPKVEDITAPKVTGTLPADGTEGVPINTVVEIYFDEGIEEASLLPDTIFVEPDIGHAVIFVDNKTIRLVFLAHFLYHSQITVTVNPTLADFDGNTLATAVSFTFFTEKDEVPPPPSLALGDVFYTNKTPYAISGSKIERSLLVVNGSDVPDAGYTVPFSTNLDLEEGPNEFLIQARFVTYDNDPSLISIASVARIVLDTVSPSLPVADPVPPAVTSVSALKLRGIIQADETIRLRLNNLEVSVNDTGTSWEAHLELAEGNNLIQIVAIDRAGNSSANNSYNVRLDTRAPDLLISSLPKRTDKTSVQIALSADEAALFSANGSNSPTFQNTWNQTIPLDQGVNYIEVTAEDAVGNFIQKRAVVVREDSPPSLLATVPTEGQSVSSPTAILFVYDQPLTMTPDVSELNLSLGSVSAVRLSATGRILAFELSMPSPTTMSVTQNFTAIDQEGSAEITSATPFSFNTLSGATVTSAASSFTGTTSNKGSTWSFSWNAATGAAGYEILVEQPTLGGNQTVQSAVTNSNNIILSGLHPLLPVSGVLYTWYMDGSTSVILFGPLAPVLTRDSFENIPVITSSLLKYNYLAVTTYADSNTDLVLSVPNVGRIRIVSGPISPASITADITFAGVPSFGASLTVDSDAIFVGAPGQNGGSGCVYSLTSSHISAFGHEQTDASVLDQVICGSGGGKLGSDLVLATNLWVSQPFSGTGVLTAVNPSNYVQVTSISGMQHFADIPIGSASGPLVLGWNDYLLPQTRSYQLFSGAEGSFHSVRYDLAWENPYDNELAIVDFDGDSINDIVIIRSGATPELQLFAGGARPDLNDPDRVVQLPMELANRQLTLAGSGRIGSGNTGYVLIRYHDDIKYRAFLIGGIANPFDSTVMLPASDVDSVLGPIPVSVFMGYDFSSDGTADMIYRNAGEDFQLIK